MSVKKIYNFHFYPQNLKARITSHQAYLFPSPKSSCGEKVGNASNEYSIQPFVRNHEIISISNQKVIICSRLSFKKFFASSSFAWFLAVPFLNSTCYFIFNSQPHSFRFEHDKINFFFVFVEYIFDALMYTYTREIIFVLW